MDEEPSIAGGDEHENVNDTSRSCAQEDESLGRVNPWVRAPRRAAEGTSSLRGSELVVTSEHMDVTAEAIERLTKYARVELGEENADVTVMWKSVDVERAADLDSLMAAVGETITTAEIEQG